MFTPTPPAPTLGSIRQNFAFRLFGMRQGDQFTIIEDLPETKRIRSVIRQAQKSGKDYPVFLIRISMNGFEADLELMETELSQLAIAVPREIKNYKGVTLANNGSRWEYVCQTTESMNDGFKPPITQPVSPEAQKDAFLRKMCEDMTTLNKIGTSITPEVMLKIADAITPGDAMGLIAAAKTKGLIFEQAGVFKVT